MRRMSSSNRQEPSNKGTSLKVASATAFTSYETKRIDVPSRPGPTALSAAKSATGPDLERSRAASKVLTAALRREREHGAGINRCSRHDHGPPVAQVHRGSEGRTGPRPMQGLRATALPIVRLPHPRNDRVSGEADRPDAFLGTKQFGRRRRSPLTRESDVNQSNANKGGRNSDKQDALAIAHFVHVLYSTRL